MGALGGTLKNLFHEEIQSVAISRCMVIQGTKLGVVQRCMQFAVVVGIVFFFLGNRSWLESHSPVALDNALWIGRGAWPNRDTVLNRTLNHPINHCLHATSFWFEHDGIEHRPTGCRTLGYHEAATTEGENLFIPTLITERTSWHGQGAWCNETGHKWCSNTPMGGTFAPASGTGCSCTFEEHFFAESPEEEAIRVLHGFQVDISTSKFGPWLVEGRIDSAHLREGPHKNSLREQPHETLLTMVLRNDGSLCTVGGKSEWLHADARNGISGTVQEWLACAGTSLDDAAHQQTSSSGLAPHLRTMGFVLQFTFDYQNQHALSHRGVVCYLTIEVHMQWTSSANSAIHLGVPPTTAELTLVERAQTRHGIRVAKKVIGRYQTFDVFKIVNKIVSFVVIIELPRRFTYFLLLYCLGITSEIYRRAIRSKFDTISYFQNAVARILIAEAGFRGLMGGKWTGSCETLEGLTKRDLFHHMCDIFGHHISTGEMQESTLKSLTAAFFRRIDSNGTGDISCQEFMDVALQNEAVDKPLMARFFSKLSHHGRFSMEDVLGHGMCDLLGRVSRVSSDGGASVVADRIGIINERRPQLQEHCMHVGNEEMGGCDSWTATFSRSETNDGSNLEEPDDDRLEGEVKNQTSLWREGNSVKIDVALQLEIRELVKQLANMQNLQARLVRRLERLEVRDMMQQLYTEAI